MSEATEVVELETFPNGVTRYEVGGYRVYVSAEGEACTCRTDECLHIKQAKETQEGQ